MKMMKLLFAVVFLLGIGIIASCKKEKIATYGIADNIYFNYAPSNNLTDNVGVTFGFSPLNITDSTFKLPVKITGTASGADRSYNIKVDTGTTAIAGKHYILPATFILRKNRYIDTLKIKLLRTADEQSQEVALRLTLQPSDELHTELKIMSPNTGVAINVNSFKIRISDMLIKDSYWDGSFAQYFGIWSAKKLRLINQVTGMALDYTSIKAFYDNTNAARMSYYAIQMTNYLNAQKAAGQTVYEADGITPITMGPTYQ